VTCPRGRGRESVKLPAGALGMMRGRRGGPEHAEWGGRLDQGVELLIEDKEFAAAYARSRRWNMPAKRRLR